MERDELIRQRRRVTFDIARTDLDLASACVRASQTMCSAGSVGAVLEGVNNAIAHLTRVRARMADAIAHQELPGQDTLPAF